MWKVVAVIRNCRFTAYITYHDSIHGFWSGRGTGSANLKDKLLQKVVALREAVLPTIFLNLNKAYNSFDMSR